MIVPQCVGERQEGQLPVRGRTENGLLLSVERKCRARQGRCVMQRQDWEDAEGVVAEPRLG